jgi:protein-S-isoprenylcysteine O-methyltransferase Ste14
MPYSKNILVVIVLPAFLILVGPYFLVGGRLDFLGSMGDSWLRMLGVLPFGAGVVLVLLGAYSTLVKSDSSPCPAGIFRYTRNPIMFGVLMAVAAQYLLYDWPPVIAYLAVLFVGSDCLIRLIAEPRLLARHGEEYRRYLDAVPRWLPRRETAEARGPSGNTGI